MTKSDMITTMFEDIKEMIATMDKKIDHLSPQEERKDVSNVKEENEPKKEKRLTIGELFNHITSRVDENMRTFTDKIERETSLVISSSYKQMNQFDDSTNKLMGYYRKRRSLISKIIGFQVAFALSTIFNIYLLNENQRLKDNDLMLKYLKATNRLDMKLSNKLDTIFHVHRNEEAIDFIKQIADRD